MINISKLAVLAPPFYVRGVVRVTISTFVLNMIEADIATLRQQMLSLNTSVQNDVVCVASGFGANVNPHEILLEAAQRMTSGKFDIMVVNGDFEQKLGKIEASEKPQINIDADAVMIGCAAEIKGMNL